MCLPGFDLLYHLLRRTETHRRKSIINILCKSAFVRLWYNRTMKKSSRKRIPFHELAPVRLVLTAAALLTVAVYYLTRGNSAFMEHVYYSITKPYHVFMARLCSHVPFSVAEAVWTAAAVFVLIYLIVQIILLIRGRNRILRVYRTLLTVTMTASLFWAGFSLLWSPCYYAPSFAGQSGISDGPVSVDDLTSVTKYMAALANEYSDGTERGADGVCTLDRSSVLDRASGIYDNAAALWPFLDGEKLRPKAMVFSRLMSALDFTGYYFPMTGEANLNMDFTAALLPETAEHEISHQRGIAREQECNFIAAAACLASDDNEFRYSGALMAYIYLGNALKSADESAWQEIASTLSGNVKADLAANNAYWAQFQNSAVQKASNNIYGDFLEDNGQTLRLKSYGACVNLLVNYYH